MSVELAQDQIILTYEQALMTFRNEVNRKNPPSIQ